MDIIVLAVITYLTLGLFIIIFGYFKVPSCKKEAVKAGCISIICGIVLLGLTLMLD